MFTVLRKKASVPGIQSKRRDMIIEAARGSTGKTKRAFYALLKDCFKGLSCSLPSTMKGLYLSF